jgi:hypothetical protein
MKLFSHLSPSLFVALILTAGTTQLLAQTATNTNKVAPEKKTVSQTNDVAKTEHKSKAGPFHGKLVAVDKVGKTITVGKRTFLITSETKLKKAGKPATLEDATIGEDVSGYVKPKEDGKLTATSVNFGPKAGSTGSETKKKETADKQ